MNTSKAKEEVWPVENAAALAEGRVEFMPHDFFQANPVKGAEVYLLRWILHNWPNEACVRILSAVRASMGPRSRLLIAQVFKYSLRLRLIVEDL